MKPHFKRLQAIVVCVFLFAHREGAGGRSLVGAIAPTRSDTTEPWVGDAGADPAAGPRWTMRRVGVPPLMREVGLNGLSTRKVFWG